MVKGAQTIHRQLGLSPRNFCTLDARVGRWTLHAGVGLWTLGAGLWTLDPGRWTLEAGHSTWTLDAERLTVDFKTLKFKTVQSFGNNGSISINSFLNSTLIKIFGHFRYENLSTVYSFQDTLSDHLIISKGRGFQTMWRGKVDLKWINTIFSFC